MNKSGLQLAGWTAAISAALTIPLFAFQMVAARTGPTLLSTSVQLVNVLLFLYVLSRMRRLLAQKQFVRANAYIAGIIGVTLCVQLMAMFATALPYLALPILVGFVVLGILYMVTGIKLLNFSAQVPGLTLVSYAAIVVGACSASIVLALVVLPASMAMDIGLAIVFFRQAGYLETGAMHRPDGNSSAYPAETSGQDNADQANRNRTV